MCDKEHPRHVLRDIEQMETLLHLQKYQEERRLLLEILQFYCVEILFGFVAGVRYKNYL